MSAVLAIDQGTSATKALVVADDGAVLGTGEAAVHPRYGEGGAVEQDPGELLDSVLAAGRAAAAEAGVPVAAMGLANQGESVLAWDRATGEPHTPIVVWQDKRAAAVAAARVPYAAELAALTGLPLDPYFTAPKLAWLRENRTRAGVVTTTDTWLLHRLTGAFVTDAATASRSLLLDLDRTEWSPRALELFGLAGEDLPAVVDCAGPIGTTTAFGAEIPVTAAIVDQQAALYGQGCRAPGQAKCTYGTGAFLLANTGGVAVRSGSGLSTSVAWRLAGRAAYCVDAQVYTAAAGVRWLTRLGVLPDADHLDEAAMAVRDAGGVVFVPALSGLGAPWWRDDARGAVVGLGLETEPGHLVRALIDGLSAQVAELIDAVARDTGRAPSELRTDGGLTRSHVLMQTQADLAQVPVRVAASPDATALGVAALTRLGTAVSPPGSSSTDHAGSAAPGAAAEGAPGSPRGGSYGAVPEGTRGDSYGMAASPPDTPAEAGPPSSAVYEPRIGPAEAAERRAAFRVVLGQMLDAGR